MKTRGAERYLDGLRRFVESGIGVMEVNGASEEEGFSPGVRSQKAALKRTARRGEGDFAQVAKESYAGNQHQKVPGADRSPRASPASSTGD